MPDFAYTARTKAGAIQKDKASALDERSLIEALRNQGLIVTAVRPIRPSRDFNVVFASLRPIRLLDKITLIKNLGVMIKAGLPLSRCLKILSGQTPNPRLQAVVSSLAILVESGTSLADAMDKYPHVFPPVFVSMVRVGETAGTLEQNLKYLAEQMQRDYDLISKARGALTYPLIVLVALGVVGFLMFTFVLPKLTATFTDLRVPLPFTTQIVISMVNLSAHYGIWLLLLLIALAVGFVYWRKSLAGRRVLHKLILYTPILAGITINLNLARFTRVVASLIKSGMSIVEALEVSSHVVGNLYFQKTIAEAAEKVKIGSPLPAAFRKQPRLFSNLVIQMMEVGEESGTTDAVLAEVAEFYEAEVDQTMKNLSSILEPVIMIVIGVVVGFLAVALITPIYNITQSIS